MEIPPWLWFRLPVGMAVVGACRSAPGGSALERRLGRRTLFAAVFPALPAGAYTIWRNDRSGDERHTSVLCRWVVGHTLADAPSDPPCRTLKAR